MDREVSESLFNVQRQATKHHDAKTHVALYKPTICNYAVVARTQGAKSEMFTNWVGSRRISRILSDFTVKVEHLVEGSTFIFQVCRLRSYANPLVNSQVQIK